MSVLGNLKACGAIRLLTRPFRLSTTCVFLKTDLPLVDMGRFESWNRSS